MKSNLLDETPPRDETEEITPLRAEELAISEAIKNKLKSKKTEPSGPIDALVPALEEMESFKSHE